MDLFLKQNITNTNNQGNNISDSKISQGQANVIEKPKI